MDASPVGVSSAWSTIRTDAVHQALTVAAIKQQAKAQDAVLDMVRPAGEPSPSPRPPQGQGERVDVRV
jgi:hypothetical protein